MSKRWGFDKADLKSALRHTVIPLVAGAAQMAFDAYSSGAVTIAMAGRAAAVAVASGLLRAVLRWGAEGEKAAEAGK